MKRILISSLLFFVLIAMRDQPPGEKAWIRINQLGYIPSGIKVAVWCSKDSKTIREWKLVDAKSGKTVAKGPAGKPFGEYGPFTQTYRLNFSDFQKPGRYYLQAGGIRSPEFKIDADVYKGTADFCRSEERRVGKEGDAQA